MKISDYPKFESALSQGRPIIFLCGAGLSVSLGDHAKGWVGWLKETRLWFQECSYNNKTTLSPLVISELSEEEELEFINVYLEAYLNNVADDDTKVKYSSVLPDTADQIYSNFKTALKEECDRLP